MNIVTTYFTVKRIAGSHCMGEPSLRYRSARQQEYVDCLARNAMHPAVEAVALLVEGVDGYAHFAHTFLRPLLAACEWERRRRLSLLLAMGHVREGDGTADLCTLPPTFAERHLRKIVPLLHTPAPPLNTTGRPMPVYADLFHTANQLFPAKISMVCNADIHLSATRFDLRAVQDIFAREPSVGRVALALTRHEADGADGLEHAPLIQDYRGSHDGFVFRPPVPSRLLRRVAHPPNCYQAENIVIHELRAEHFTVLNPCVDLRIIHRHVADVRQWLPSVDPSRYGTAEPMDVAQCLSRLVSGTPTQERVGMTS